MLGLAQGSLTTLSFPKFFQQSEGFRTTNKSVPPLYLARSLFLFLPLSPFRALSLSLSVFLFLSLPRLSFLSASMLALFSLSFSFPSSVLFLFPSLSPYTHPVSLPLSGHTAKKRYGYPCRSSTRSRPSMAASSVSAGTSTATGCVRFLVSCSEAFAFVRFGCVVHGHGSGLTWSLFVCAFVLLFAERAAGNERAVLP
jgi:hypothetical protein